MLSSPKMFWVALKFSHYFTIGLLNAEQSTDADYMQGIVGYY